MKKITTVTVIAALLSSCNSEKKEYDASGTFEAVETIISAEASGVIRELDIKEGLQLEKGQVIGYIDSLQLHLRRKQLQAQIKAVLSKTPNAAAQLAALKEQLVQAEREKQRIENLHKAEAASQKQLDDIRSQVVILQKQIEAMQSTLGITSIGLNEETMPLAIQTEQLNDQISKCRLVNPLKGTVLVKYAEANEMTAAGKPLYKIADLSELILRAYVTGDQLTRVKAGGNVTVLVDSTGGTYQELPGTVEWISDEAEFTPKTIQTKDERANLVYATKIRVKNNGTIKIGMYGEVIFK